MLKIFLLYSFIFLVSCSGYEFVYNEKPIIKEIKKNTLVVVNGSDSITTSIVLKNKLGKPGSNNFLVDASITKKTTPITIDKDGSVTKHEIKHTVSYIFMDFDSKCEIASTEIITTTTYNSSASGYNFASDVGKGETNKKNIEQNVEKFLDYIASNVDSLSCKNES